VAARILLVSIAVLALAWVGVALRDAVVLQHAGDTLFSTPPPDRSQFQAGLDEMKSSDFLNPDPTGKIDRARFLLLHRKPRAALDLANGVVADEPDNVAAWAVVYQAGTEIDPARAEAARAAIIRLDPQAAKRRR
jgi:hypothetical protein